MDTLLAGVNDRFQFLLPTVLDYAEALGLENNVATTEYEAVLAKINFSAAAPPEIEALSFSQNGRALLFSTGFGEPALESRELGSGLFSFYFREALSGAASNSEGIVTLLSAYNYLRQQIHGYEHFRQQPVLVSNVSGDPILTSKVTNWLQSVGKRVALLVGVDEYSSSEIPPVRYSESDAKALAEILTTLGGFECRLLTGSHATQSSVLEALWQSLDALSMNDSFLFYFTGHGFSAETEGYAMLRDSNHSIPATNLRLTELARLFEQSRAGLTVAVFDACMTPHQLPNIK